jgi:acetyl-CoA carboxylase biotin carboxyl carrier protein
MKLKPSDLEALISAFEAGQWSELRLRTDEWELLLSTNRTAQLSQERRSAAIESSPGPVSPPSRPHSVSPPDTAPARTAAAEIPSHWRAVKAPNLGTFYRSPKPGAPPLVDVGHQVQLDTELCLIEVMKLFTTLPAGVRGIVRQVCVNDGDMVEHGDVLFYIEPN